ncbi:uncharacterized protein LOC132745237 [Ruditapes philippinarum]|uniref:uncharacterized protein LOC132745237 n=1 Tax=Ruditapes philippinarum TaxID=129788 RepID=UPI00295B237B|nr:uncharacterized protein LOC132745237 [Ruditapes philippinarum]
MAESRQIPVAGNFRKRKENASEISFSDFSNPWTFYALFSRDDLTVATWLIEQGLLGRSRPCERADCDGDMRLARRSGRPLGYTLRCNRSRDHEVSIMKYSFFERSKLDVRDIMQLIKTYLEGLSLGMTSRYAGVSYTGTAVDWGSFIRELMKEYFHVRLSQKKMSGIVEIDESLFGRRVKFHRGDPNKGLKVWVFGMVERSTNSLILYPVKDRTADTLIPLIERHVEKGSTIYSDGFSAYFHLNDMGYRHFTVIHKYSFKKTYKNAETGDIEVVHTNRIEGAWKHAKDYFRKMSGTKASQWEGHMAEVSKYN